MQKAPTFYFNLHKEEKDESYSLPDKYKSLSNISIVFQGDEIIKRISTWNTKHYLLFVLLATLEELGVLSPYYRRKTERWTVDTTDNRPRKNVNLTVCEDS